MNKILELSQTLSSKICHDLAGSVGAIDTCLSFIENESVGARSKHFALLESQNLIKRLRFFRSIYGVSDKEEKSSVTGISEPVLEFFNDTGIKFEVHIDQEDVEINCQLVKAIICLVHIASENVGSQGSVDLYINDRNNEFVKIVSNGRDLQPKQECFAVLNGESDIPLTTTNCREYYVRSLCEESGYKTAAKKNGSSFEYLITKK